DCGTAKAQPILLGVPSVDLRQVLGAGDVELLKVERQQLDPAWDCLKCGRKFGRRDATKGQVRSRAEWCDLIRTMLPQPVAAGDAGELLGGDPVAVIVNVIGAEIAIMEAAWDWQQTHVPTRKAIPFATVPLRTPAVRVAELIVGAWARRLGR